MDDRGSNNQLQYHSNMQPWRISATVNMNAAEICMQLTMLWWQQLQQAIVDLIAPWHRMSTAKAWHACLVDAPAPVHHSNVQYGVPDFYQYCEQPVWVWWKLMTRGSVNRRRSGHSSHHTICIHTCIPGNAVMYAKNSRKLPILPKIRICHWHNMWPKVTKNTCTHTLHKPHSGSRQRWGAPAMIYWSPHRSNSQQMTE